MSCPKFYIFYHLYYNSKTYIDQVENIAKKRLKQLFNVKYVNVQPHSGSSANMAVYRSLLQPKDKDEAQKCQGKKMDNIDFVAHPEQLKAIVTTEENVEQVQQWLAEKGMNKNICHSFDDFVKVMEQERFNWIPPYQADIAESLRNTLQQDDIQQNNEER